MYSEQTVAERAERMEDRALRDRWIKALRSGEYTQTKHYLRNKGGFCCLGVLCDLIDPDDWEGGLYWRGGRHLPEQEHKGIFPLTALNDSLGYSFEQIADFIEEHL